MIQVIETNLSIDKDDTIRDHQSRIIEVEDWDTYCKAFEEYNGEAVYFKSKTMRGNSILSNCTMTDLIYDDIHLSCMVLQYQYQETENIRIARNHCFIGL